MADLLQDVRFGLRMLVKRPGFTLVALVTLALGIGANTALFSVVSAVLLRPLPFEKPEGLYCVWSRHTSRDRYPFSLPEFCDYRDQNQSFAGFAGLANWNANLTGDGDAERLSGVRVSGNMFDVLGARPAIGRLLRAEDDLPGRPKVVVLSYGLWQRRYGGDPKIVGRSVTLNNESYEVAGVLSSDFLFPVPGVDVAVPLVPDADPWRMKRDSVNFLRVIARIKPGTSQSQAESDLGGIARRLQQEFPTSYTRKLGVLVVPLHEELVRNYRQSLWVLMGAVGMVLLVACANLANLLLASATARRREIAIRQALGASRGSLIRQLLVESGMLALAGGAAGTLLAKLGVPALVALGPANLPRAQEIGIDPRVLLFTLGATLLAGFLFGLVPALQSTRGDINEELKLEGRGSSGTKERNRLRHAIVIAQVSALLVLLTGAGLLLKSFRQLMNVEPGFRENVLTLRLSLPRSSYGDTEKVSQFYRRLSARVGALPGVESVAAISQVPLNGALATADFKVADRPPANDEQIPTAVYRMATPGYFRTMGIPLLAGREFEEGDTLGRGPVVIVSATLAQRHFPDRSPIGQHLLIDDNDKGFRPLEIVGLAGDVKHNGLDTEATADVYLPYFQTNKDVLVWLIGTQFLVVRTSGESGALATAVRRELQAVDPNVAASQVRTMGQYVEASVAPQRFNLQLLAAFAGATLVLAVTGLYGVVSYLVVQRRREIGVRMALGAQPGDILRLILGQGLRLTTIGLVLGLAGALALTRAIQSLLYGVRATDPVTFAGAILVMTGVALLACYVPARRAARLDPLATLRHG